MAQYIIIRKRPLAQEREDDMLPFPTGSRCLKIISRHKRIDCNHQHERQGRSINRIIPIYLSPVSTFVDDTVKNEYLFNSQIKSHILSSLNPGGRPTGVIAFGQTGSGKTFTLTGSDADSGLLPRSVDTVLQKDSVESISFTVVEIYGHTASDLLHAQKQKVRVLEKRGVIHYYPPLTSTVCSCFNDFRTVLNDVNIRKRIGHTRLNNASSRSHLVYQIKIHFRSQALIPARLMFVDLAGMERPKFSIAGANKQECISINRSLFALKECVRGIGSQRRHIPYRGSTLTLVLRDLFRSNRLLFIATVNPSKACVSDVCDTIKYAESLSNRKAVVAPPRITPIPPPPRSPAHVSALPTIARPAEMATTRRLNTPHPRAPSPHDQRVFIPPTKPSEPNNTPVPRPVRHFRPIKPAPIRPVASRHPSGYPRSKLLRHHEAHILAMYSLLRKDQRQYNKVKRKCVDPLPSINTVVGSRISLINEKITFLQRERLQLHSLLDTDPE